jgi:hypothetical protein
MGLVVLPYCVSLIAVGVVLEPCASFVATLLGDEICYNECGRFDFEVAQ